MQNYKLKLGVVSLIIMFGMQLNASWQNSMQRMSRNYPLSTAFFGGLVLGAAATATYQHFFGDAKTARRVTRGGPHIDSVEYSPRSSGDDVELTATELKEQEQRQADSIKINSILHLGLKKPLSPKTGTRLIQELTRRYHAAAKDRDVALRNVNYYKIAYERVLYRKTRGSTSSQRSSVSSFDGSAIGSFGSKRGSNISTDSTRIASDSARAVVATTLNVVANAVGERRTSGGSKAAA